MKLRFEANKIVDEDLHIVFDCNKKEDMIKLCDSVNAEIFKTETQREMDYMTLSQIDYLINCRRNYDG